MAPPTVSMSSVALGTSVIQYKTVSSCSVPAWVTTEVISTSWPIDTSRELGEVDDIDISPLADILVIDRIVNPRPSAYRCS